MIIVAFQDNVFVTVVASIQYRALSEKASDAFYKLSNTKGQIQAYVFDGTNSFCNDKVDSKCSKDSYSTYHPCWSNVRKITNPDTNNAGHFVIYNSSVCFLLN